MGELTRKFLTEELPYKREWIDYFLDDSRDKWAKYDPELGYIPHNCDIQDGVDGAWSLCRYEPTGERRMINWADRPCRINTYGDSFTHGDQVSDGETWQEILAAHLGEPIRNYGVGGYGVYQAYRRMLREEATPRAAQYVILNIYDDDHVRSLDGLRYLRLVYGERPQYLAGKLPMSLSTPWAHLRMDLNTGEWIEHESFCPTPEALYHMCDPEYVYELLKDDHVTHLFLAQVHGRCDRLDIIESLAELLQVPMDFSTPAATAGRVHQAYGLWSSRYVLDRAVAFAAQQGKKLMALLSYPAPSVLPVCKGEPRWDRAFVDALAGYQVPVVDSLKSHLDDFTSFRISPEEYVERYYVDHYNPLGNHFFAFAIKDAVVAWLDPKPPAYRHETRTIADPGARSP